MHLYIKIWKGKIFIMPDKGKTILILGNGFDLAHGLPTKYSHFLDFCCIVDEMQRYILCNDEKMINEFKEEWINNWETTTTIKDAFLEEFCKFRNIIRNINCTERRPVISDIGILIEDNIWYRYFIKIYDDGCMKGENWIDFESEIRLIIKIVDENSLALTDYFDDVIEKIIDFPERQKLKIFKNILKYYIEPETTVRDFREKAFEDLERLTRALELYLGSFVEKIQINAKIPELENLKPDYVINFNYTDTYERFYKKETYNKEETYNEVTVYHIHGKVDITRSEEENNMVLGIDEYWTGDKRDERTDFTIFKKFVQRIQKHTGNENYKYLKEIQDIFKEKGKNWSGNVDKSKVHSDGISYVYIFGHSLDVTDKDILSSFVGDDSTSVTVYCRNKGTEGELIANTIKLIGAEKLLDKSNYIPTKLDFVIQKEKG
jgi:hypothetical protein